MDHAVLCLAKERPRRVLPGEFLILDALHLARTQTDKTTFKTRKCIYRHRECQTTSNLRTQCTSSQFPFRRIKSDRPWRFLTREMPQVLLCSKARKITERRKIGSSRVPMALWFLDTGDPGSRGRPVVKAAELPHSEQEQTE